MSQSIGFGEDENCYGILFPMGSLEKPCWEMSFYQTERGRKTGIAYIQNLLGSHCPIYKFELMLKEIVSRSVVAPFIPKDRRGSLKKVVKVDWKPRGNTRPKYKDN